MQVFRWGALTLTGSAEKKADIQIDAWDVMDDSADLPGPLELPHGIALGDSWQSAVDALPDAQEFDSLDGLPGLYLEDGNYSWIADQSGKTVGSVHYNLMTCD